MQDELITYFEQRNDTSTIEQVTLRRLRDHAVKLCEFSLKQKKIVGYFKEVRPVRFNNVFVI